MYNSGAEISETSRVTLPEHQDRKVVSVAQELMANTITMPMLMHVGLSSYFLKQNDSKELVQILNKFRHGISFDDAQRYISTQAHQFDLQTIENGVFIPSEIVPGRFTHCVLDNLDFYLAYPKGSKSPLFSSTCSMDQGLVRYNFFNGNGRSHLIIVTTVNIYLIRTFKFKYSPISAMFSCANLSGANNR